MQPEGLGFYAADGAACCESGQAVRFPNGILKVFCEDFGQEMEELA